MSSHITVNIWIMIVLSNVWSISQSPNPTWGRIPTQHRWVTWEVRSYATTFHVSPELWSSCSPAPHEILFPSSRTGSKVAGSTTERTCIHRSCYITKLCYLLTIAFLGAPSGHLYSRLSLDYKCDCAFGSCGFLGKWVQLLTLSKEEVVPLSRGEDRLWASIPSLPPLTYTESLWTPPSPSLEYRHMNPS